MTASSNRAQRIGEYHILLEKQRKLTNKASGILSNIGIATYLSPLASPFDLDGQKVMDYAGELILVLEEGKQLRMAIDAMKDELGIV